MRPAKLAIPRPEIPGQVRIIQIPHEEENILIITIEGTNPLLQNPKTERYLKEIEAAAPGGKKPLAKKRAIDPQEEVEARLRQFKDGSYGHPTEAFTGNEGLLVKSLQLVEARKMKLSKDNIKGAVMVLPDAVLQTPEGERGFVRIVGGKPVLDKHFASVQSGKVRVPIPVYRPKFAEWKMVLRVSFNPRIISEDQLLHLFVRGGVSYGLGAYRREKGGTFGTFKVVRAELAKK